MSREWGIKSPSSHRGTRKSAGGDALRLSTGRTALHAAVFAMGSAVVGFVGIHSDMMLLVAMGFGMAALFGAAVPTGLSHALVLDRRGLRRLRFGQEREHLVWAEVKNLELERGRRDWVVGLRAGLAGGGSRIVSLSLSDPRSWARLISQARARDLLPGHVRLGPDLEASVRKFVRSLLVHRPTSPEMVRRVSRSPTVA